MHASCDIADGSTRVPCVSVIIPIHNAEAYLIETLESVLSQDLHDIEVICVDDGSTDRSAFVVEQFASHDARLRLVSQRQSGASAARNKGIEAARGAFIAFLDADDIYESPTYLRTLYEGAIAHNQLVSAGCFVNWRGDELERVFSGTEYDGYQFVESKVMNWADYQFDFGFHRFMFSRDLFANDANRFSRLRYFEDPVFMVRILEQAESFYATDQESYLYRCEYKPRNWTTGLVLDFLEGASQNLAFSRERGYAKLHWYTVQHMEFNVWEIGVGVNPALALDVIDAKLRACEQLIDQGLLAEAGETQLPYTLRLRKAFDAVASGNPLARAYLWARQKYARR